MTQERTPLPHDFISVFNRENVNTGLYLLSELCRANIKVGRALKVHSRSKQVGFQGKGKVNVIAENNLVVQTAQLLATGLANKYCPVCFTLNRSWQSPSGKNQRVMTLLAGWSLCVLRLGVYSFPRCMRGRGAMVCDM